MSHHIVQHIIEYREDYTLAYWVFTGLVWSVFGVPVYLFSGGYKMDRHAQGLTLFCGPAVWMIAFHKVVRLRSIREPVKPPPLPVAQWEMPRKRL